MLSDRDMSVIFMSDARDYIAAVGKLQADAGTANLVAPTYFLRSHAIELLLKALLLANGWTLDDCRKKLGHRLLDSLEEAEKFGLMLTDQTKQVITTLSARHEDLTFRYRPKHAYAFPNQTVAASAVTEVFEKVDAVVFDKCLKSAP